eukprot:jgi/Botrbrau1/17906/Bobra.50_1s0007.1
MATKLSISVTSRGDQCYIGHGWPRSSKNYPPAIVAKAEPGTTIPDAPASSKGLEQVGRKEVGPSKSHIVALPRELREAVKGRLAGSDFAGAFRSQPEEYDYWIDSIEGEIPETLRGTLFRNGPGNFERGGQLYAHMLDGDGYICRFSFHDDGRVHFRSRYVQTRELGVEKAWGRILYRTTFGTQRWGRPPHQRLRPQIEESRQYKCACVGRTPLRSLGGGGAVRDGPEHAGNPREGGRQP